MVIKTNSRSAAICVNKTHCKEGAFCLCNKTDLFAASHIMFHDYLSAAQRNELYKMVVWLGGLVTAESLTGEMLAVAFIEVP